MSHDQLINALEAGVTLLSDETQLVMSMALKVVKDSAVYVMEFEVVHKSVVANKAKLDLKHEAVIEVHPPLPGV